MYARFGYSILFVLYQSIVLAQNFDENSSGSWLEFSGTGTLNENWSIPVAGILRHHELFETYDFFFIRTGITYHFNDKSSFTGGIAYVNSKSYPETGIATNTKQYWIYEQFTLKTAIAKNNLSHRFRLENRWINKPETTYFTNRFRYRLQYTRPISRNVYFKTSNELFVNLDNHWFNQNRFYIGLGRKLTPNLKIDLGYLKNHFRNSALDAVLMGLNFNIDLRRNEIALFED